MADIATSWNPDLLAGDWSTAPAGLAADGDLATAVVLSLFTDALAAPSDALPDGSADRRGWWGDAEAPEGAIGSKLWLLVREKQTETTRRRAETYADEALAWLVRDGVARQVTVQAAWGAPGRLDLVVTVTRADGSEFTARYGYAWRQLAGV